MNDNEREKTHSTHQAILCSACQRRKPNKYEHNNNNNNNNQWNIHSLGDESYVPFVIFVGIFFLLQFGLFAVTELIFKLQNTFIHTEEENESEKESVWDLSSRIEREDERYRLFRKIVLDTVIFYPSLIPIPIPIIQYYVCFFCSNCRCCCCSVCSCFHGFCVVLACIVH